MQKGVSHKNMACVFFCVDKKESKLAEEEKNLW